MPHIEEKELDILIDKSTEIDKIIRQRNIIGIAAAALLFLLLIGIITYFWSATSFLNTSRLANDGFSLVNTEEYENLKEFKSTTKTAIAIQEAKKEDENSSSPKSISDEIIYAVQIGAFKKRGVQLFSSDLIQFNKINKEEFYKYSVGAFSTLDEAKDFRKELVSLGFDDAFIGSYQNGERLRIEDAY